jgi:phage terminase large subunit-like protein
VTFSTERAMFATQFVELLKLTDDFYGQPFKLLNWQHDPVYEFYGRVKQNGLRKYQYMYLEVPKKNGKSPLGAALALYHTYADGAYHGEVYNCAADRAQASIVFDVAVEMIDQSTALKKRTRYTASKKEIYDKESRTTYKVLSAEAFTKHGIKPTCVVFDELHAQPNRDLWDVMTFGAGSARKEPVWIILTTAGDDPDRKSIGWEIHEYARKVILGEINDPVWLAKIYGAPEEADIFDENTWHQVNPSLGHTINIETVRQEALSARNSEASERLFRWLRLNQWVSVKRVGWQPLTLWDTTTGKWDLSELVGKRCYPGLDLSSTTDITGACYLFPPQDGIPDWRAIFDAWIPEDNMKERVRRDKVPYDRWVNQKHMHATPGNVVDYEFVEAQLLAANKKYNIQTLGTDPWNSRMLTQRLMREGIEVIEITQDMKHMSPAMKMLERLMKRGEFTHEENPVARWCWGNVAVAVDGNENIKPMKNKSVDRIDLTVAMINAMITAMITGVDVSEFAEDEFLNKLWG